MWVFIYRINPLYLIPTPILIILLIIGIWVLVLDKSEDADYVETIPKMSLQKDPKTDLLIYDTKKDKDFGSDSFHAAVINNNFLVRGVPTTIVLHRPNTNPTIASKGANSILLYSDILNPACLDKLSAAIQFNDFGEFDAYTDNKVFEFIKPYCGEGIFKSYSGTSSDQIPEIENLTDVCSEYGPCAPCVIILGFEKTGLCNADDFKFKDETFISKTPGLADSRRFLKKITPVTNLGYLKFQKGE